MPCRPALSEVQRRLRHGSRLSLIFNATPPRLEQNSKKIAARVTPFVNFQRHTAPPCASFKEDCGTGHAFR
ncbi:MAG: hypothetical protein FWH20_04225, partial [Oscillospiraceae bacterium]|nr:hypothetical protein [Oscillospiraceae bacterium]